MSSSFISVSLVVGIAFKERDVFDVLRQHAECWRGHGQPLAHKCCSDCGGVVSVKDVLQVKPAWAAFLAPEGAHGGLRARTHDGCQETLSGIPFTRLAGLRVVRLSPIEHCTPDPVVYCAGVCVGVGHDSDQESFGALVDGVPASVVLDAGTHVLQALGRTPFKTACVRVFPYLHGWRPDFPPGV